MGSTGILLSGWPFLAVAWKLLSSVAMLAWHQIPHMWHPIGTAG